MTQKSTAQQVDPLLEATLCGELNDAQARQLAQRGPEEITPVVTEHTIYRDYCPNCKKDVEPVVPDAMPGATLGHSVVALDAPRWKATTTTHTSVTSTFPPSPTARWG